MEGDAGPLAMASISDGGKSRGRPKVGATHIGVRVPPDQLAPLDAWIATQPDPKPGRPEAIRAILAEHLSGKPAIAIAEEPAAASLSDEDRAAMWKAEDQGTEDMCRQLKSMTQWYRDPLLQALAIANIDDVLHRYGWRRTVPYNVRRRVDDK